MVSFGFVVHNKAVAQRAADSSTSIIQTSRKPRKGVGEYGWIKDKVVEQKKVSSTMMNH